MRHPIWFALLLLTALPVRAQSPVDLFNGKDLTGWVNVNCAPGTFYVKGNEIITNGSPTGFMRTEKQYENFVLELEWMHVREKGMANSGVFVWGDPIPAIGSPYTRGIEVQVLANYENDWATSDGDVFSIWGAKCKPDRPHPKGYERCLPSEKRTKPPGQWNHYKIIANDGAIKLHVNGKEVSGVSRCNPRKGYLALESEGAECHFRNIKLQELPSTNPKPEEIATVASGHVSMFDGLTLTGWKTAEGTWKAADGIIKSPTSSLLVSDKKFTVGELVYDWRFPAKAVGTTAANFGAATVTINPAGEVQLGLAVGGKISASDPTKTDVLAKPGSWNRTILSFDGKTVTATVNGKVVAKLNAEAMPPAGPVVFHPAAGLDVMNVFVKAPKE